MWKGLVVAIPLFFGGNFDRQVVHAPAFEMQKAPDRLARWADAFWRRIALTEIRDFQSAQNELQPRLAALQKELGPAEATRLEVNAKESALRGSYGTLPEVYADKAVGTVYPKPFSRPERVSWFQIAREMALASRTLERAETLLHSGATRKDIALQTADLWTEGRQLSEKAAAQVRHVETWLPLLEKNAATLPSGGWTGWSPEVFASLRESLRPQRILFRDFLPRELKPGMTITLPITTDLHSRKFKKEVEDSLEMHWNRSPWARGQQIRFRIRWREVPEDSEFADGRKTLEQHLQNFPEDGIGITSGSATNYVHKNVLVLSPTRITVRGIAHELGHLIGFGDCYLRTLGAQGFAGMYGLAVLEWDNPVFPDDLMCDDQQGVARAEKW